MTDYERVMVNMNQQDIATTNGNGTTVKTNTNTTEENTNKGMNANNTSTFENNSTNNTPNNSEDNTTTITTNPNNNNNNNKNNKITPLTPDASNDNDQKMLMDSSAYQKENENIYTSVANRNNIGITDEKDNNNITDHNNDTSIDINNDINNNINNNNINNNDKNNNNDNNNNNNDNTNNNDNENRNDNNDITNNNEQDHDNNNNNNNKDKDNKDQENNESVGEDSELEPLQQATLEEQEAARQENTTTTETIKSEINTNEPTSTSSETNVSVDADADASANANADPNADATVVTAAQPPPPDLTPSKDPLPDHQHKYATTSIRNIKRLKDARPFLVPVDPVALNIPQYFQYITKPVDLSLIEKKLQLKVYSNVEEFYSDFKLMVDNCVRFNGETSGIAIMAKNLFQAFEKHMNNMPSRDLPKKNTASNTSSTSSSGGGGGSSSSSNTTTSTASQSRSGKSFTNGTSGVESAKAATATSAAPASKRPKRQIHPPKTKDLYYNEISKTNAKPKDKNILQDLNFAKNVVKDLMSKKYININFAFLEPVDPVALNLPTYFDYVKNPMDLGTISKKLANWEYKNLEQVQSDIELVFNNCFAFNPVGTPVNDLGVKLKAIYEKEWMKRPEPLPPTPEPAHQGSGYYYGNDNEDGQYDDNGYGEYDDDSNGEYSDEEIDEASVTTPAIQFMEQQLVQIQQELKKLRKIEIDKIKNDRRQAKRSMKQKMVKRKGNNGRTNGLKRKRGGAVGMSSGPGNHKRSKSQQLEVVATYEMKKYMAEKLEHLTPNELDNISTFVQANIDLESLPKDEAGEWVFDLNHFPNDLVVTLYNTFFKKYTDFHNGNGVAATPVSSFGGNSAGLNNHLTVGTPVAYGSSVSTPADHHVFYPHANGANATIMGQPVSGNSISPITNPALLNASGRKKSRSDEAEKISQIKQKLEMLNATASPGQSLGTPTSISNLSKGSVPSLHGSDSQSGESDDDMSSDESEEE